MQRIRERSRTEMRVLRGTNAAAVLQRLNPIIRGWAAYYRTVVSKHAFTTLVAYVWWLAFKWAVRSHRNKPMTVEGYSATAARRACGRCRGRWRC
jgi:RNA-directed DNA polymerase